MDRFVYKEEKTREISFPLGGIGTGCVGLAGNGQLVDMGTFNRPNKGSHAGMSHFAVKAEAEGNLLDARVIETVTVLSHIQENITGLILTAMDLVLTGRLFQGFPTFRSCDFKVRVSCGRAVVLRGKVPRKAYYDGI